MYIGGYISQDVLNAVLSYIIAFIFLGSVATASSITTWMACAQLVSVGLAIWLTLRIHAAASYRIALGFFSLGILGFAALYFSGVADIRWFLAVAVIAGLGRGALNFIPWSVYNYMPDVDEIVTGRRREGAFAGVMTFIRKLLQSAVVFAVGPILDASGLVRSVKIQPVHVVNTAVTIMLVGSLGLMIFGFLVSLRFRLNRDTHTVLMDEIERFKKQPGTAPTPENRAIVEDLTGWKYEELGERESHEDSMHGAGGGAHGARVAGRRERKTALHGKLDRGLVAVQQSDGKVFLSWRLLADDPTASRSMCIARSPRPPLRHPPAESAATQGRHLAARLERPPRSGDSLLRCGRDRRRRTAAQRAVSHRCRRAGAALSLDCVADAGRLHAERRVRRRSRR